MTCTTCKVCGRLFRNPKGQPRCPTCSKKRVAEIRATYWAIVQSGKCPDCGRALKRNTALSSWWQCEQYGEPTRRKDPSAPECAFQCFVSD